MKPWLPADGMTYHGKPIVNRDGVWWFDAPAPRRFLHRHSAWTVAQHEGGYEVRRCACGATQYSDLAGWVEERKPRFR